MTIRRNSNENNARCQRINHTDAEFFEIMNREGFVDDDDLSGWWRPQAPCQAWGTTSAQMAATSA